MIPTSIRREVFLDTAEELLGRPYIWGGDDPSGLDCSGLVIECFKACGLLEEGDDMTANQLRLALDHHVDKPYAGCLLFTMKDGYAKHVVICIDEYYCIGASGGGSKTTSEDKAWDHNAYVKLRPIPEIDKVNHILVDPFKGE